MMHRFVLSPEISLVRERTAGPDVLDIFAREKWSRSDNENVIR